MRKIVLNNCTLLSTSNVAVSITSSDEEDRDVILTNIDNIMGDIIVKDANLTLNNVGSIQGTGEAIVFEVSDEYKHKYKLIIEGSTVINAPTSALNVTNAQVFINDVIATGESIFTDCMGTVSNLLTSGSGKVSAVRSFLTFTNTTFSTLEDSESVLTLNGCTSSTKWLSTRSATNANLGNYADIEADESVIDVKKATVGTSKSKNKSVIRISAASSSGTATTESNSVLELLGATANNISTTSGSTVIHGGQYSTAATSSTGTITTYGCSGGSINSKTGTGINLVTSEGILVLAPTYTQETTTDAEITVLGDYKLSVTGELVIESLQNSVIIEALTGDLSLKGGTNILTLAISNSITTLTTSQFDVDTSGGTITFTASSVTI